MMVGAATRGAWAAATTGAACEVTVWKEWAMAGAAATTGAAGAARS